jgi:PleD family two-component response regulator
VGLASASSTFTLEALIGRADRALYAAKARGRNRVEVG